MSSMRNAVQRRSHRERAQPLERQRLGLLEKHKDYKLRAQDHNRKKAHLKNLRSKADERNEDEFYFGMLSREGPGSRLSDGKKWKGTVRGDRGNKAMSVDTVRLLKTQDIGYVRTMRSVVGKQVQRLREQVVFAAEGVPEADEEEEDDDLDLGLGASAPTRPKKIVFMDEEAQPEPSTRDEMDLEVDEEEADDVSDQEGSEEEEDEGINAEAARKLKNLQRLRAELEAAETKLKALADVERELEIQQAKMAKTATSGGTTRKGKQITVKTRKR